MAKLVGTFFHSHGGTTSMPGELWRERRITRPIREDVPIESDEENIAKANRVHEGFRVLREKIAELKTDVLICFSDDQLECFDFNNYPAFAIYVGDTFRKSPRVKEGPIMGRHAEPGFTFKGHPGDVWSVAFSSDSTRIIAGNGDRLLFGPGEVKLWDAGPEPGNPPVQR